MSRREPVALDGHAWTCKGYVGEEWLLRRAFAPDTSDTHGWVPARVPGSVVDDLVRAGSVADPLDDLNSRAAEWVAERTWVYRRSVTLDHVDLDGRVELELDGIDHAAAVYVNGVHVGDHLGAFTTACFEVGAVVHAGDNLVAVVLAPAPDGQPHIGRSELVDTFKSRMTYGWDFCPRLVHVGVWDRARLTFPTALRIRDLFVRPTLSEGHRTGRLRWRIDVEADAQHDDGAPSQVIVEVERDGRCVASTRTEVELRGPAVVLEGDVEVERPELWWPNGHGDQPLYRLRASVVSGDVEDVHEVTTAFRSIELAPNQDAPDGARPYTFVVNGERVHVQGWNWVPMSIHHGVEDHDRLEHLLGLAARAGTNLLRVWGGGLIERSDFYLVCDRLGLLVWQEFPLSSSLHGSTPSDDPQVVEAFVADARSIVRRRRNHPSLALWCGGNELDDADGRPADGSQPVLAAIEKVVAELDPDRPWLPTSPTGPVATCTLDTITRDPDGLHDVHGPWEHQGLNGHRELYDRATSLLHSEFGVEGMANVETIEAHLAPEHRWPADRSNPHVVHRGDFWVNTPLVEEVFGPIEDLATLVRASQFLQADGLRYAIEANRRRQWRQSGSIPWQLNEPFPNVFCTSAVDHSGRPKAAYYAVAEAYAELLVGARVPLQAWSGEDRFHAEVWASSRHHELPGAAVEVAIVDAHGHRHHERSFGVDVTDAGSTQVGRFEAPLTDLASELFWLELSLHDRDGALRSTSRWLCSRDEDLRAMRSLPAPDLEVERPTPDRLVVRNVGTSVAVGVTASDARPVAAPGYVWFDAGHLTLVPGEERSIGVGWIGVPADPPPLVVDAWNAGRLPVA